MTALVLLLAFALGSILGGQIIGRLRGLDLRHSGSGNLGATNALRSGGSVAGISVLLIDAGKAWLAATALPQLLQQPADWLPWACAMLAVLGHIYSPLAGFHGGKGVAAGDGAYLALLPQALLVGVAGFLPCLLLTGYVSLSVMLGSSLILLYVACFSTTGALSLAGAFATAMLALLTFTHRENLQRLVQGRENRFEKVMLLRRNRHDA